MSKSELLRRIEDDPSLLERLMLVADSAAASKSKNSITTPEQLAPLCFALVGGYQEERLGVIALDRKNKVIESTVLTIGSDAFTIVCPKQILRWVLTRKRVPAGFALTHNHPSGDSTPSIQDVEVTRRVKRAADAVGLGLLDHIVVTADPKNWTRVEV